MSKLRKLTRLVYDKVKHLPWKTTNVPEHSSFPSIQAPSFSIRGVEYIIKIQSNEGLSVTVFLLVGGRDAYPGGEYTRYWPWAWERKVFKRVLQNVYGFGVIPSDDVVGDLIAHLEPVMDSEGGLSIVEKPSLDPKGLG